GPTLEREMSMILTGLLIVQVLSALAILVLVMLQQGKGTGTGAAFVGGSAGSLFGAAGAASFLSRSTKWAPIVYFAATLGLAYVSAGAAIRTEAPVGVMEGYQATDPSVPQVPGAAGDASVPSAPAQDVPVVADSGATPAAETPAPAP